MKNFPQDFLLLIPGNTLIAALNSGEYAPIGLTLKVKPRELLNEHLVLLRNNLALKMKEVGM